MQLNRREGTSELRRRLLHTREPELPGLPVELTIEPRDACVRASKLGLEAAYFDGERCQFSLDVVDATTLELDLGREGLLTLTARRHLGASALEFTSGTSRKISSPGGTCEAAASYRRRATVASSATRGPSFQPERHCRITA